MEQGYTHINEVIEKIKREGFEDVHATDVKEYVWDNCSIFYKDIRVSVRIETQPKDGSLWRKCYVGSPHKPEGRNLPTFSLLNHKVFGSDSDVGWHKNFRKHKDNKIK